LRLGVSYMMSDQDLPVRLSDALESREPMPLNRTAKCRRREAALKEGEARFRIGLDGAPLMLWVSGPDKLCTFVNSGWRKFTGRTLEQALSNGWAQNVHPDDLHRCLLTYKSAFDARESFAIEHRLRRADGEYRSILDGGVPRFDADGVFQGYIGTGTDITEINGNRQRPPTAQEQDIMGALSIGIARYFANLLGCILADAEGALANPAGDRWSVRPSSALTRPRSARLKSIGSSSDTGQPKKPVPIDFSPLVQEVLRLLQIGIPKAKSKLDFTLDLSVLWANAAQIPPVVAVTSALGHGTAARIMLPRCNAAPASILSRVSLNELQSVTGSVLVVEDEDTLRHAVVGMLRKIGISVLEAANGNLAVDLIRAEVEDVAVVLLDLTLPGRSSQEVFDELRRARPHAKVILTSAYGRDYVAGSMELVADEAFIRKPYRLSELIDLVRIALSSETYRAGKKVVNSPRVRAHSGGA
jgi:PAS domain S-box-containing protein